jgi:biopolymer transport protein ExbB
VARGLSACLANVGGGAKAMEDGFQEQLLHELPRLERSLSGIGMLAAVAPLLGLLGTVTGIIQTFGVIRVFGNANPGLMAGGIAEALVTTATGLVIAIPTLLFHSVLRSRVELLTGHAEQGAATLLNHLAGNGGS